MSQSKGMFARQGTFVREYRKSRKIGEITKRNDKPRDAASDERDTVFRKVTNDRQPRLPTE